MAGPVHPQANNERSMEQASDEHGASMEQEPDEHRAGLVRVTWRDMRDISSATV
jgi:hypothetical protein